MLLPTSRPTLAHSSTSRRESHTSTIQPLARNRTFNSNHAPLRRTTTLQLDSDRVQGPVSFLNPTRARFTQVQSPTIPGDEDDPTPQPSRETADTVPPLPSRPTGFQPPQPTLTYQWTSRNSRKGRQTLLITDRDLDDTGIKPPAPSNTFAQIDATLALMFTCFPIWDISFDVAFLFALGSLIWILNGAFAMLPFWASGEVPPAVALNGGGITAFIGGLVFAVAGVLAELEAINEERTGCFG